MGQSAKGGLDSKVRKVEAKGECRCEACRFGGGCAPQRRWFWRCWGARRGMGGRSERRFRPALFRLLVGKGEARWLSLRYGEGSLIFGEVRRGSRERPRAGRGWIPRLKDKEWRGRWRERPWLRITVRGKNVELHRGVEGFELTGEREVLERLREEIVSGR